MGTHSWAYEKRWRATIAVSLFTFASTVTSSGIAPGTSKIAEEFGITSQPIAAMTVSMFVLAYGGYDLRHTVFSLMRL